MSGGTRNIGLVLDGLEVSHRAPDGGTHGSPILSGVSLSVDPGEFVALVGGSGSGKTLTAMSCLQLLPPSLDVTGGSIRLGGLDLTKASENELNTVRGGQLGMLFQQPKRMFNPNRTIEQHLREPLRLHAGLRGSKARTKALELLEEVGFADPVKGVRAYPHQLSGGMAQRAMTALALAGRPGMLLADEPTSALDKVLERQILQLLDRERRERGLGILYITHNVASVAAFADRVLVMNAGRIVEAGPAGELLTRPKTDYARELLAAARLAPESRRRPPSTDREVLVLDRVGKHFGSRRKAGPRRAAGRIADPATRGNPRCIGPVRLRQEHPGQGHRGPGGGQHRIHHPPAGCGGPPPRHGRPAGFPGTPQRL